jgi:hypothetical protein
VLNGIAAATLCLQEFLSGLAVLRQDFINSSNSDTKANSTAPDSSGALMINARLAAYESALGLLCGQLSSLVSGAAAVKASLRQAGLLPSDGSSIRAALQEAAAAGQLAGWASQGLQEMQQLYVHHDS